MCTWELNGHVTDDVTRSIVTKSLSPAIFEILASKCIGVTTLTFLGHVTSSVTWAFDSQGPISYKHSRDSSLFGVIGGSIGWLAGWCEVQTTVWSPAWRRDRGKSMMAVWQIQWMSRDPCWAGAVADVSHTTWSLSSLDSTSGGWTNRLKLNPAGWMPSIVRCPPCRLLDVPRHREHRVV